MTDHHDDQQTPDEPGPPLFRLGTSPDPEAHAEQYRCPDCASEHRWTTTGDGRVAIAVAHSPGCPWLAGKREEAQQ